MMGGSLLLGAGRERAHLLCLGSAAVDAGCQRGCLGVGLAQHISHGGRQVQEALLHD